MNFLDDLTNARNELEGRINERQRTTVMGDVYGESALGSDRRRAGLLDALSRVQADGGYRASLDDAVQKNVAAAQSQIARNANRASGDLATQAARAGTLGGSRQLAAAGSIVAQAEAQRGAAAGAADDARTAGLRSREDLLREYLSSILNPTAAEQGVQSAIAGGEADLGRLDVQMAQANGQFRGALANALAGVVQNGITPAITAGFNRADRLNDREYQQWVSGDRAQPWNGGQHTWTLSGR
jgi:hypothetical protein